MPHPSSVGLRRPLRVPCVWARGLDGAPAWRLPAPGCEEDTALVGTLLLPPRSPERSAGSSETQGRSGAMASIPPPALAPCGSLDGRAVGRCALQAGAVPRQGSEGAGRG